MNLAGGTWAALRKVSRRLNREFRCEAARCGLSVAEAQLLALLHDAVAVSPLDEVLLDGFRACDVAEPLRLRNVVGANGHGFRLVRAGCRRRAPIRSPAAALGGDAVEQARGPAGEECGRP